MDVEDPATGDVVARFVPSPSGEVDAAVVDAHRAQTAWARRDPVERSRVLLRVSEALRSNADVLARLETIDSGKPLSQSKADIAVSARYFEYYAGAIDKFGGETIPQPAGTFTYTTHEPLGVVAHITPWNAPLSQMTRGVAPCLAAGNAVVVKPSELTPLTTLLAARLFIEAGLPAGLCNVVLGLGAHHRRGADESPTRAAHHVHRIGGRWTTGRRRRRRAHHRPQPRAGRQVADDRVRGCRRRIRGAGRCAGRHPQLGTVLLRDDPTARRPPNP